MSNGTPPWGIGGTVVMYGVSVSAPTSPLLPKTTGLTSTEWLIAMNPRAATIDELNALVKRVEALEQAFIAKQAKKRRKHRRKP